jgi:hypothetical protein
MQTEKILEFGEKFKSYQTRMENYLNRTTKNSDVDKETKYFISYNVLYEYFTKNMLNINWEYLLKLENIHNSCWKETL